MRATEDPAGFRQHIGSLPADGVMRSLDIEERLEELNPLIDFRFHWVGEGLKTLETLVSAPGLEPGT